MIAESKTPRRPSTADAAISFVPLPRYVKRTSLKKYLLILAAMTAAILAWAAVNPGDRRLMLFMLVVMAVMSPIGLVYEMVRRRKTTSHIDARSMKPVTQTICALHRRLKPVYWNRTWWEWKEFKQMCRTAGVDPPRTVVDERVRWRLERIELTPEMLEAEAILPSSATERGAMYLILGTYALIALLGVAIGNYSCAFIWLLFGVFIAATFPPTRDLMRNARWDDYHYVATPGAFMHKGERRWTINDAMMMVQTEDGEPPYYVSFVGEAGHLILTFTDEKDPDFVKLWQRWNHPKPRPELVIE